MMFRKLAFLSALLAFTPTPAASVGILFNIGGDLGGATVGAIDYTGGGLLFSVVGDTDDIEAAVGRPWQWQLQGDLTQLYVNDAGMNNFVYALLDTPLLIYSGDGPLPFVGLALPDGTRLLEFAADSLGGLDLSVEASFAGLTPTYFNTSLFLDTDQGLARLSNEPTSYTYTAGNDLALPIPEPGTWTLFVTGFAATGVAVRRQRVIAAR